MSDFSVEEPIFLDIGKLPNISQLKRGEENLWFCGKYQLRVGFKSKRKLIYDGKTSFINSEIISSSFVRPLFRCTVLNEREEIITQVQGLKSTTTVKLLWKKLNLVSKKKWPGPQFFGFGLKGFANKLKSDSSDVIFSGNINIENTAPLDKPPTTVSQEEIQKEETSGGSKHNDSQHRHHH